MAVGLGLGLGVGLGYGRARCAPHGKTSALTTFPQGKPATTDWLIGLPPHEHGTAPDGTALKLGAAAISEARP